MTQDSGAYHIAFFADSHLGYAAHARTNAKGINVRVQDGYDALGRIISEIITSDVRIDCVVHGGDFFHTTHPTVRDTVMAQHYLRALTKHGIPFRGLAGNHDAPDNRTLLPSIAPIHDPDRDLQLVWSPYEVMELPKSDGVYLHLVPHHGLSGDDSPKVKAVSNGVNIFTSHGAALDPKNYTLMSCQDSPREQVIPNEMILDTDFSARLLGHYHSHYAVGGDSLNTWYAGSALRRGFSDEPGPRGWMLVRVFPDGQVKMEFKPIAQRNQYDLHAIDAAKMSPGDLQDIVEANLLSTRQDPDDDTFFAASAPIVRQKILNATRAARSGLDRARLARLGSHTLAWKMAFETTEEAAAVDPLATPAQSMGNRGSNSSSVLSSFDGWAKHSHTLSGIDESLHPKIIEGSLRHLKNATAEN